MFIAEKLLSTGGKKIYLNRVLNSDVWESWRRIPMYRIMEGLNRDIGKTEIEARSLGCMAFHGAEGHGDTGRWMFHGLYALALYVICSAGFLSLFPGATGNSHGVSLECTRSICLGNSLELVVVHLARVSVRLFSESRSYSTL